MLPAAFSRPLFKQFSRAFTLIELIVVIIVIGLLATLATVSYSAVIERTEAEKVLATQRSVAREVSAILAFQDGTSPEEALAEALEDLPAQAAGLLALTTSNGWTLTAGVPDSASFTDLRTVVWSADSTELSWAVAAAESKVVSCSVSLSGNSSACLEKIGDVTLAPGGGGTVSTVPVAAPSAPQNLVVTPGDSQLVVTWDASASDGGDSNITYVVSVDPAVGTVEDQTASSALITGLINGTEYTVSVVASNSAGVSPAASMSETPVSGGLSFAQISVGRDHTCAVSGDGQAFCWGTNGSGRLGDGTTTSRSVPTPVDTSTGLTSTNVAQISAGSSHTCALTTAGQVFCWGNNSSGRLGNNSLTQSNVPTTLYASAGFTNIAQISAGSSHTCAVTTGGQAYCWGNNTNGSVGNNSTTERRVPTAVNMTTGLTSTNVAQISAGSSHTCVVTTGARAYCWGYNATGTVGDNATVNRVVPTAVSTSSGITVNNVAQISAGESHTCAVTVSGQAYCWGWNSTGQLGTNNTTDRRVPTAVSTSTGLTVNNVARVAAGQYHTCAVTTDGKAYCWGNNGSGRLGDNSTLQRNAPTPVDTSTGLSDINVAWISGGSQHSCALTLDSQMYCWGYNNPGRLGDSTTTDRHIPVMVVEA